MPHKFVAYITGCEAPFDLTILFKALDAIHEKFKFSFVIGSPLLNACSIAVQDWCIVNSVPHSPIMNSPESYSIDMFISLYRSGYGNLKCTDRALALGVPLMKIVGDRLMIIGDNTLLPDGIPFV